MDMMNKTQKGLKGKRRSRGSSKKLSSSSSSEKDTAMKVVYISTPMKVKTSASKFRATVQELTGRESDVVGIMESHGGRDTWMVSDHLHHDGIHLPSHLQEDADVEFIVDPLNFRGNEGFGCFDNSSNLFYDQFLHQLDVFEHAANS